MFCLDAFDSSTEWCGGEGGGRGWKGSFVVDETREAIGLDLT